MEVAPLAVAVAADRYIVAGPLEAQPGDPERAVRGGGDGRPIVLAILMADERQE
jgi:hypothetical protein